MGHVQQLVTRVKIHSSKTLRTKKLSKDISLRAMSLQRCGKSGKTIRDIERTGGLDQRCVLSQMYLDHERVVHADGHCKDRPWQRTHQHAPVARRVFRLAYCQQCSLARE